MDETAEAIARLREESGKPEKSSRPGRLASAASKPQVGQSDTAPRKSGGIGPAPQTRRRKSGGG